MTYVTTLGAKPRYLQGHSVVYTLRAHLVFTPKYRSGPFTDEILRRCEEVMRDVCTDFSAELRELNGQRDHVHLLVYYPPKVDVSRLVGSLKRVSARRLWQEFHCHIRKYLVSTSGRRRPTSLPRAGAPCSPPSRSTSRTEKSRLRPIPQTRAGQISVKKRLLPGVKARSSALDPAERRLGKPAALRRGRPAQGRPRARLRQRGCRLQVDPAVHLPHRRPPGRPGPQRHPRLVLGRPHRRPGHRRRRGQGRPRRMAGQGLLCHPGRRGGVARQRRRRLVRMPPRLRLLRLTEANRMRRTPAIARPGSSDVHAT